MSTLKLDKVYEVIREGENMISLKGPRGAEYKLIRNVNEKSYWALTQQGRTTWYYRDQDGKFSNAFRRF